MQEFISEDDLNTFEGWLKYQGIDPSLPPERIAPFRKIYDEEIVPRRATPKIGRMQLRKIPGEYRYAVALDEGDGNLWLTLWVKRSRKGEFFVMVPRDSKWDPHESYHLDGTYHSKSYGEPFSTGKKRQPLTDTFRGCEHLGYHAGHGPKTAGAICDPADFNGVVRFPPGVLGPRDGVVAVDLVEPGHGPMHPPKTIVVQQTFKDVVPWVIITVGAA